MIQFLEFSKFFGTAAVEARATLFTLGRLGQLPVLLWELACARFGPKGPLKDLGRALPLIGEIQLRRSL